MVLIWYMYITFESASALLILSVNLFITLLAASLATASSVWKTYIIDEHTYIIMIACTIALWLLCILLHLCHIPSPLQNVYNGAYKKMTSGDKVAGLSIGRHYDDLYHIIMGQAYWYIYHSMCIYL